MPCITLSFDPAEGPLITVGVASPDTMKPAVAKGEPVQSIMVPMLVDSGADITCIAPEIASAAKLRPIGKRPVQAATGLGDSNTYIVDLALLFGDPAATKGGVQTMIIENLTVPEFLGAGRRFKGLLGRDVICRGLFSIHGWANSFTLCM